MTEVLLVAAVSAVAVLLASVGRRWWRLRRTAPGQARALGAFCVALLATITSFVLALPPAYRAVDRLAGGVASVPHLLQHLAAMVAMCWLHTRVSHLVVPGAQARGWRRAVRIGLVVSVTAMVALYLLGPLRLGLPDVSTEHVAVPQVAGYHLVMAAYVGAGHGSLLWLGTRFARHARGALRTGLLLIAAGSGLTVGIMANRLLYVAVAATGRTPPWGDADQTDILWYLAGASLTLIIAGMTIPRWGPRLARWHRRYLLHLRLRPLWIAVYRASRDIALVAPRPAVVETLLPHRIAFHLHRRVVEIRDGLIGPLRPYLDPAVLAYSRRLGGRGPTAEAACIAVALRARHREQPAGDHGPAALWSEATDLDSEAEWLAGISRSLVRSPVVATTLDRWRGARTTRGTTA